MTTLHLIALILTIPAIMYADHIGFKYFTGKIQTVNYRKVQIAHWFVTGGLILLIITGVIITIPMWAVMFENPFFYAKLAFVVTLFLNGIFIGSLMKKATIIPFARLSKDEKKALIVSGALSGISWTASILIGFLGL